MRNISTSHLTALSTATTTAAWSHDEQKLIDTARDILMRQRNLSQDDAMVLLKEMAEKRKTGLPDIATQLVEISKMLTI